MSTTLWIVVILVLLLAVLWGVQRQRTHRR